MDLTENKNIRKAFRYRTIWKQLEAVRAINDNNVCVITGGPGTGKTTIIKTILELYKQEGKRWYFALLQVEQLKECRKPREKMPKHYIDC